MLRNENSFDKEEVKILSAGNEVAGLRLAVSIAEELIGIYRSFEEFRGVLRSIEEHRGVLRRMHKV